MTDVPQSDPAPPILCRLRVLPSWLDYNGHMTEGRYLLVCSEVTDALLALIGADRTYVAGGHSYYTVETHVMHLGESHAGELLEGSVQVLDFDAKRIHVFVRLCVDGNPRATLEQILVHVDAKAGRAVPAPEHIQEKLARIRGIPFRDAASRVRWPQRRNEPALSLAQPRPLGWAAS